MNHTDLLAFDLGPALPYVALLGRALLSATFLISAVRHALGPEGGLAEMRKVGMPSSRLLLLGSIALRLLGGAGLLVGGPAGRPGAALLVLFLLPATALFHARGVAPEQRVHQQVELLNNLAILGGLLLVLALGPGPAPWAAT